MNVRSIGFLSGLFAVAIFSSALAQEPVTMSAPEVVNKEIPPEVDAPVIGNQEVMAPAVNTVPINAEVITESASAVPMASGVPVIDHSAFNKIKSLAGRWEGVSKAGAAHGEDKIAVTYEVTAGGYAVMERLFPGTAQEMITMYYENKGKLYLTNFGILGNRPVMELLPTQGNIFEFALSQTLDLDPIVDTHLHSFKIVFVDKNVMNQEWKMFEAGKEVGSYSFQLTRVASNP